MRAQSRLRIAWFVALAVGTEFAQAQENALPQMVEFGDTRPCYMKLKEPNVDGQQVGDLEVLAIATIGADGKVVKVDVPLLETLKAKSWAKNRIQRWATCVVKAMRWEPARQDDLPVAATVELPLKSWTEVRQDLLEPRQSMQAELRSTPEEYAAAYRACVVGEMKSEQRMLYQFSVDEDGRPRGVRNLDSNTLRVVNAMGRCIIDELRFEPSKLDGKFARMPVHWGIIITPQTGN